MSGAPPWILEISRLLASARRGRPSGMERVELAYARHVLNRRQGHFAGTDAWGRFGLIAAEDVAALLDALPGGPEAVACVLARIRGGLSHRALLAVAARPDAVFSIVGHHGLQRGRAIAALRGRGARFVPAVHDLIPLEHPDTTRWLQRAMTWARLRQVTRQADGVLLFSHAVRGSLSAFMAARGARPPPMLVAGLGLDLPARAAEQAAAAPYFLCVATIEKRKNHALLLDVWQALEAEAPLLVLVGRRSFGAGATLARLDTGQFRGVIEERGHCTDAALASLLAGARALLLPTRAEGYGIPVAEALAAGVPVICSDIAALREVGGAAPEYLAPDDLAGWQAMIAAYAAPDSPYRARQLARIADWQGGDWPSHFAAVENFLMTIAKVRYRP